VADIAVGAIEFKLGVVGEIRTGSSYRCLDSRTRFDERDDGVFGIRIIIVVPDLLYVCCRWASREDSNQRNNPFHFFFREMVYDRG
jgi:hypothetical protein